MTNKILFDKVCFYTSKMITTKYSSSFSRAVRFFSPEIKQNIYNIYGFVRVADEIVDTFHDFDKKRLIDKFIQEYHDTLELGISSNPVINAFYITQKKYSIKQELVDSFLTSMKMDLGDMSNLNEKEYNEYIYGSAEVVGLMCLQVFVKGDHDKFEKLKPYAQSLGAALQKINFLRDFSYDFHQLNRVYFPNIDFKNFSKDDKIKIEKNIEKDFKNSWIGIKQLPISSRYAVYLAYIYYYKLFMKIKTLDHSVLFKKRISIPNSVKTFLFVEAFIRKKINFL